ncbi:zinc-ribbon domain containing protein [Candidatus Falkowbacteria bacterium]|nr:zinc-ribbon domain containing protein [Candidatus Falkowbacteria bacterium]
MPTCKNCNHPFTITDADKTFYARINVPAPTLCPDCREQRRLVFRNERNYYRRQCDLCQKNIISVYDPAVTSNVYCNACWWGDGWDAKNYAREFDWSRPFFEQYRELLAAVPKIAMMNDNGSQSVNCEYTYDFAFGKNAYMVVAAWRVEDSMYGLQTNWVKDSVDNINVNHSELMYESVACEESYGCQQCQQCQGCRDCIFGYDLRGCHDCILSSGLRNQAYCIWNKPYSKEAYEQEKAKLGLDSWASREACKQRFAEFILKTPRKYANLLKCQDSTGDNLVRCKNSQYCFVQTGLQDCKFMIHGDGAKDCYDCRDTGGPELCYDSITPDNSYQALFVVFCWKSQYVAYSDNCHGVKNIFGCVGMKKAHHCILNKQYDEFAYEALKGKIIEHMQKTGEWGQFFSPAVTLFAYNETAAQEWSPLTKEQAVALGYRWQEALPELSGKETLTSNDIPDSINQVTENICNEVLACVDCGKNYKVIKQEYEIYKKLSVPIPRRCVLCRYQQRSALMNPKKLWHRQCMCQEQHDWHQGGGCKNEFETTYSPDRPERVYCEECYQKEIY